MVRDHQLILWDLVKGKKIHTSSLKREGNHIAFHPDGEVRPLQIFNNAEMRLAEGKMKSFFLLVTMYLLNSNFLTIVARTNMTEFCVDVFSCIST